MYENQCKIALLAFVSGGMYFSKYQGDQKFLKTEVYPDIVRSVLNETHASRGNETHASRGNKTYREYFKKVVICDVI